MQKSRYSRGLRCAGRPVSATSCTYSGHCGLPTCFACSLDSCPAAGLRPVTCTYVIVRGFLGADVPCQCSKYWAKLGANRRALSTAEDEVGCDTCEHKGVHSDPIPRVCLECFALSSSCRCALPASSRQSRDSNSHADVACSSFSTPAMCLRQCRAKITCTWPI